MDNLQPLVYRKDSIKPPPLNKPPLIRWFMTKISLHSSNRPPWALRVFRIMQVKNKRKSNIQVFNCVFGLILDLSNCLHSPPPLMPSLSAFDSKCFRVLFFSTSSCKEYLIFFHPFPLFHIEDMLYMSQIFRRQQFESAEK